MRRHFNYTDRITMKRDSVNVELQENGQSCCVEDKNLADYDFPPDAQLFLEIYDR
jgi:hypothetical protein